MRNVSGHGNGGRWWAWGPAFAALVAVGYQATTQAQVVNRRTPDGIIRTVTRDGAPIDTDGAFFQALGTNGRTCFSCHEPSAGWTMTPREIRERFRRTRGLDPLFRAVDGANRPDADLSTLAARESAFSMLLDRGVIRVEQPVPVGPLVEFEIIGVQDPWGFVTLDLVQQSGYLSVFRRPLPTTNLRFQSAVMWDGRASATARGRWPIVAPVSNLPIEPQVAQNEANLLTDLGLQANDALLDHFQPVGQMSDPQIREILAFEMNLATAMIRLDGVGRLDRDAIGGPETLRDLPFYHSINDSAGADAYGRPFQSQSFTLFDAWRDSNRKARASVARGADVFQGKPLGPPGTTTTLRCTTCHGVPLVGTRSLDRPANILLARDHYPGLPIYTLRRRSDPSQVVETTDPGVAIVSGRWSDIGLFKTPSLRGVSSHPPYFHNGAAESLDDVVDLYKQRFDFELTEQEQQDLVLFLKAL